MGYESKLYVIEKTSVGQYISGKTMYYAQLICIFDLGKCYHVSNAMREYPNTNSYIYSDDDAKILEDKYGNALTEIPLKDAINIIEAAQSKDNYRRYVPALAALKALEANKDSWGELVILHYGY